MINIDKLTEEVKELALQTGEFLRQQRKDFNLSRVETKHSHDYVSYVDKESERRIVTRLYELLPEAGFIAEEGSGNREAENYWWVVDPLDGTTNFIHDHAPYCVSIALKDKHETLLGVVYECCRNELYWANKNSKAYLNGNEINVSKVSELNQSLVILGLPYDAERYRDFIVGLTKNLYGRTSSLRNTGSAASEICYVACGRFEAFVEGLIQPWDITAGLLILKQAGGKVSDFSGGKGWTNGEEVVATNGMIHEELLQYICNDEMCKKQ